MLVLHYTGMTSAEAALDLLCAPAAQVSAHWLIDEAGTVYRLVDEYRRAWHAGVATWRGAVDVNSRSIGIELANPGHDWGYRDFAAPQIAALVELCGGILARHPIPPRNVVAHSDIAPTRKLDPGERFPWARLAAAGIGAWPDDGAIPVAADAVLPALARWGYGLDGVPPEVLVASFQRHFRPAQVDGVADRQTRARLAALLGWVAADAADT
ncbi:MAG: N-acetylmuramoyl-L-alanine amidase [Alphaproteobacteria bacterium]|nr:N-acetylmuramoyl-L-alanine amidase [Alphaproteobacteria bacterium]